MGRKQKILWIKIGALGDVVMSLPVVRAVQAAGHEVTWVVGTSAAPLVREFTTHINVIEVDDQKILRGPLVDRVSEITKLQVRLAKQRWDLVWVFHSDARYRLLAPLASRPRFYRPEKDVHHTRGAWEWAYQQLGQLPSPESQWPQPATQWNGRGTKKIALAPGGAKNILADDDLRRWPLEHYRHLAKLAVNAGYVVTVFGADTDRWVESAFKDIPVDLEIGTYNLHGLLQAFSTYEVLLTHDSGPLHLGGLAGIPVVGLFGPTLPGWRFPITNGGRGLNVNPLLECQPCYNGRTYAKCSHKNCLRTLDPDFVWAELQQYLTI